MSENKSNYLQDDEMKLSDLLIPFWLKRKLVTIILGVSIFLGLLLYVLSEKQYTTTAAFIPNASSEQQDIGGMAGLKGLASLAGLGTIYASGSNFPPTLYPDLLVNIDNQLALINAPIAYEGAKDSISYKIYYTDYHKLSVTEVIAKYTIGLPGQIIMAIKGKPEMATPYAVGLESFRQVSQEDMELIEGFLNVVSVGMDDAKGYVKIRVTMPDPLMAAQIANNVKKIIERAVVDYETKNSMNELKFIKRRYEDNKARFEKIQDELALFQDENQGLTSAYAMNELRRLETEYDMASELFLDMSRRLEEINLTLARDTPQITMIHPIKIPTEKSGPSSIKFLLVFVFLGLVVSSGVLFLPEQMNKFKDRLSSQEVNGK